MLVYFIALILSLLAQLIPVKKNSQYKKRLIFTFLPIFLYGALRSSIGDGMLYEEEFYNIQNLTDLSDANEHFEVGYVILNRIIPTYRLLVVFITGLMCYSFGFLFYKNIKPENCWLAVLLLYLLGGNTIYFVLGSYRNGIGMCIFLLSLPLLQKRKLFPYLILMMLASSIHTSMLYTMSLAYIVTAWREVSRKEMYFWLFLVVFFVFSSQTKIASSLAPFINDNFERYNSVVSQAEEGGHKGVLNYSASILLGAVIFYAMKNNNWESGFMCLCRLAMFFCISNIMGMLGGRNPQCFSLFFIVVVAEFLTRLKGTKYMIPFICFVILYSTYFYYLFINSEWSQKHWVYHSILGDI